MTYVRKFFLNLTSDLISLGFKENNNEYILDSFDPNKPAASSNLKKLFQLAKALNSNVPKIEINLPKILLQNETLITNKEISNSEAIEIINKRKNIDERGIIAFHIETIGTRAISITYTQISSITEVKEFVEKAGFIIKKMNIGSYSYETKNTFKLEFKRYFKKPYNIEFKKYSYPIYSSLVLLFLVITGLLYLNQNKIIYQEPIVFTELNAKKINLTDINQNLTINLTNIFPSSIEKTTNKTRLQIPIITETVFKIDKIKKYSSLDSITEIAPKNVNENSPVVPFQKELDNKKLITKVLNIKEIKNNKNFELFEVPNLKTLVNYESLFKKIPEETIPNQENKVGTDFEKIIAFYDPEVEIIKRLINKDTNSNFDIQKEIVLNNSIRDKKNENYPEMDPSIIEYAIKILPYKKPLVIDSIRILSEPTLSSGALVFSKNPKERPNSFKNLKIIKPSQIKINAKATRAPSIPKKASVGYNSTKRNFIDLDRTNLIGIFGKSSNPSALLRLSNGKIIKLKVGQWFEGWRVFAIDKDKIHVENGFKQEILRMPG